MYELCDINNTDETGLFSIAQPDKTITFQGHFFQNSTIYKQQVTLLIAWDEGGYDKLPRQ